MVIERKNHSLFLAVLILVFILYSPLFNIRLDNGVFCLTSLSEINCINGKIINSPVKCNGGKYYAANIKVNSVYVSEKKFSCKGNIKIMLPATIVEAHYPGKLYSKSKSKINTIYESGGIYFLKGKMSKNIFYVSECQSVSWSNNISGKLDYIRAVSRLNFKRLMYNWGNAGGFLLALLCGSREYTEDSISNAFRNAGLSHILALSGMHLSLFSGIAMFIGKKSKRKKINFSIRIVALILFVWFAGFSPSLLRAFIQTFLVIFASIIDEKTPDMLVILCFSFLLQIIISPKDLESLGFILSYAALSGIIVFNRIFKIIYIRFMPKYISSSLASSSSAQIFTIPISILKFGTYCPIGIIATCFVSPLVTLFIYAGLFFIIISLIFPFISNAGAFFMNLIYNIIHIMVTAFSKAPVWRIN